MTLERTPLQTWTYTLADLLSDAEAALTAEEYEAWLWIGAEQFRRAGEALVVREAERVTKAGA